MLLSYLRLKCKVFGAVGFGGVSGSVVKLVIVLIKSNNILPKTAPVITPSIVATTLRLRGDISIGDNNLQVITIAQFREFIKETNDNQGALL